MIALDYKLNFTPEKAAEIPALQERVAQRVYDLLTTNGGLYIKIGPYAAAFLFALRFTSRRNLRTGSCEQRRISP